MSNQCRCRSLPCGAFAGLITATLFRRKAHHVKASVVRFWSTPKHIGSILGSGCTNRIPAIALHFSAMPWLISPEHCRCTSCLLHASTHPFCSLPQHFGAIHIQTMPLPSSAALCLAVANQLVAKADHPESIRLHARPSLVQSPRSRCDSNRVVTPPFPLNSSPERSSTIRFVADAFRIASMPSHLKPQHCPRSPARINAFALHIITLTAPAHRSALLTISMPSQCAALLIIALPLHIRSFPFRALPVLFMFTASAGHVIALRN